MNPTKRTRSLTHLAFLGGMGLVACAAETVDPEDAGATADLGAPPTDGGPLADAGTSGDAAPTADARPTEDSGAPREPGRMALYFTDAVSDDFDHVWVSLYSVDLLTRDGALSLYSTPPGAPPAIIDLKSLGGPNQRYWFVASSTVAAGEYTGAQVVLGAELMLMPVGSSTGTPARFEAADGERKLMVRGFDAPRTFAGGEALLIDFDLAAWNFYAGYVSAGSGQYLRLGDPAGISVLTAHEPNDHQGLITSVSGAAPNQRFVIEGGASALTVQTSAETALYHELGYQSAAIAVGTMVEVTGVFDNALGVLLAQEIKVEDDAVADAELRGTMTSSAVETATFQVLEEVEAFVPNSTALTVKATGGTVFLSRRGVPMWDYFEWVHLLGQGGQLEAEGAFDPAARALYAHRLKLIGPAVDEKYNELEGPVSNIDPGALSFTVAAEEWWGLNVDPGEPIAVELADTYYYRIDRETFEEVDAATFFLALTAGQRVEVEGRFDAQTRVFRARWATFEPEEYDDDDFGDDDDGSVPIDDPTGP